MDDIEVYTGADGEPQRITKKTQATPASSTHDPQQESDKMHDKEYEKAHGGVVVEQHDHDHNYGTPGGMYPGYGAYPGYGGAGGFGLVWGIFGFIAFIVIIAWIWGISRRNEEHHERLSDKHHEGLRCMDKLGYDLGYTRKQLNDMQAMEDKIYCKEEKIYDRMCYENETMLRFGTPYGEHTQRLCTAAPQHCAEHRGHRGGGIINGSQLSETATFAVDHSVI